MSDSTGIIRGLSVGEAVFIYFNVTIVTTSQMYGNLEPLLLEKAVLALRKRHPLLAARVIDKSGQYYFQKTDDLIKVEIIRCQQSKNYRLTLQQKLLKQELDVKKQLMRVIVIFYKKVTDRLANDIDVVTITSHAMSDGMCCANFHKELFTVYDSLSQGTPIHLKPLKVLPPIEYFIKKEVDPFEKKEILDSLIRKMKRHKLSVLPPDSKMSTKKQGNVTLTQLKLNKKMVASLRLECKKQNTTLFGALYAAFVLTLYEMLNTKANLHFLCRCSVNLRTLVHPSIENEHFLTAATGEFIPIRVTPQKKYWSLARSFSQAIARKKKNNFLLQQHFYYTDLLQLLPTIPSTIAVSFIGKVNMPNNFNHFKITDFNFTTNYPSKLLGIIVTVVNQKLVCNIHYLDNHFSKNQLTIFKDKTLKIIQSLLHD